MTETLAPYLALIVGAAAGRVFDPARKSREALIRLLEAKNKDLESENQKLKSQLDILTGQRNELDKKSRDLSAIIELQERNNDEDTNCRPGYNVG